MVALLTGWGCSAAVEDEHGHNGEINQSELPEIESVELDGAPLRVVATTNIIGDVVAQVGGAAIELTVLMGEGVDPHSYEPAARDLTAVAEAHVVFINGFNLEEGLIDDIESIVEDGIIVPISAGIESVPFIAGGDSPNDHDSDHGEEDEHSEEEGQHEGSDHTAEDDDHSHGGEDPHVWFSVQNVKDWVVNVEQVLSSADPENRMAYGANANSYVDTLNSLEAEVVDMLGEIPAENRVLITNHDSLSTFAAAYDFEILGTVIPGGGSQAEPSASELAGLIEEMEEHGICTIFTETSVSDSLAQTVAGELSGCNEVNVSQLYTGSVGPAGSGADSYVGMMKANVETISAGLR